MVHLLPRVRP